MVGYDKATFLLQGYLSLYNAFASPAPNPTLVVTAMTKRDGHILPSRKPRVYLINSQSVVNSLVCF